MFCPVCLGDAELVDGVLAPHLLIDSSFCPMSGKEPFVWTEHTTRPAVEGRSGGRCEYCGARATNMHHRKALSQGGLWSPVNVLHLCGSGTLGCHGYFTEHPKAAYRLGISVHRDEEPADIPVHTVTGVLWLTDDIATAPPRRLW